MSLKGIRKNRRSRDVIIGHNTPFILWTMAAFARPLLGSVKYHICPFKFFLKWCPACGLTEEYSNFIYNHKIHSLWFAILLCGFALNSVYSLYKAAVIIQSKGAYG